MSRMSVGFSVAAVFCFAAGLNGDEPIKNWEAPAFWAPGREVVGSREATLGTASVAGGSTSSPMPFVAITPCRLLDTRNNLNPLGGGGPYSANEIRTYSLVGPCGLPPAAAVSLNATVTNTGSGSFGHLKLWPYPFSEPNVSTLNYPGAGATVANAVIVAVPSGSIRVKSGNASADVILDVNGYYAGSESNLTTESTFLGHDAGNSTMTGSYNTGIGARALGMLTSGGQNTAVGRSALLSNGSGISNTAIGMNAAGLTTGNNNTAVGAFALAFGAGADTTAVGGGALANSGGSGNIGIGKDAGSLLMTGSNNIYIGSPGAGSGESGQIRIGDASLQNGTVIVGIYGGVIAGPNVVISSGGRLGTTASSRRYKEEIRDVVNESDGLMHLRPVAFRYKRDVDPSGATQYGLIAEEVAEIYPELVVYGDDGRPRSVRYDLVNALLLSEVQKQHRTIDELEARLAKLEARSSIEPRP